jgi:hypothetical protein
MFGQSSIERKRMAIKSVRDPFLAYKGLDYFLISNHLLKVMDQ